MKLRLRTITTGAALGLGLLLVFMAYLNPDLAVELAQHLWACF